MLTPTKSRFEIRVASPDDVPPVIGFLARTAYEPKRVDEHTVAVTAPAAVQHRLARREMQVYLRLLERVCPGLAADVID